MDNLDRVTSCIRFSDYMLKFQCPKCALNGKCKYHCGKREFVCLSLILYEKSKLKSDK